MEDVWCQSRKCVDGVVSTWLRAVLIERLWALLYADIIVSRTDFLTEVGASVGGRGGAA